MADEQKSEEVYRQFLKLVLDTTQQGKDFVVEQAPLVVQELVTWQRAWLTLLAVLLVLLTAVVIALFVKGFRWSWRNWDRIAREGDAPGPIIGGAILFLVIAGMTVGSVASVNDALKVWLAPRLYVIEYIGHVLSHK